MKKYISLFLLIFFLTACGEREGTVNLDGCREKIQVNKSDMDMLLKDFTCTYWKTKQGRKMGGYCVSIKYDSNGGCKTAYTYTVKQDDVCNKQNPILGSDDMCYPN